MHSPEGSHSWPRDGTGLTHMEAYSHRYGTKVQTPKGRLNNKDHFAMPVQATRTHATGFNCPSVVIKNSCLLSRKTLNIFLSTPLPHSAPLVRSLLEHQTLPVLEQHLLKTAEPRCFKEPTHLDFISIMFLY